MNIELLAADIARRIPEMAKDCSENNAEVIKRLIEQRLEQERQEWRHLYAQAWEARTNGDWKPFGGLWKKILCGDDGGESQPLPQPVPLLPHPDTGWIIRSD